MPFGCRNATAVFQRIVDKVLHDANSNHCASAYVDDIIIYSNSTQDHIRDVKAVWPPSPHLIFATTQLSPFLTHLVLTFWVSR
jgi:hypothetical protein